MTSIAGPIAIVGGFDAAHIGGSLLRAAERRQIAVRAFDSARAWTGNRIIRALRWRLADRQPTSLERFGDEVLESCVREGVGVLIATGGAPISGRVLTGLAQARVTTINYSTDDPWNPSSRSRWFFRALPQYRIIATTRRANVEDLRGLGCADVRYLPFAFDEGLHAPISGAGDEPAPEVLFVGGADADRVAFVTSFLKGGLPLALVGGYWDRYPEMRKHSYGCRPPEEIRRLTAAAKVNLCIVRRANRDGHVMRTFEIAAIGGCMLVEDTNEHRDLFGPHGQAVQYFRTPEEASARAGVLLQDGAERTRLGAAVRARIASGLHSYGDRLTMMMNWAAE